MVSERQSYALEHSCTFRTLLPGHWPGSNAAKLQSSLCGNWPEMCGNELTPLISLAMLRLRDRAWIEENELVVQTPVVGPGFLSTVAASSTKRKISRPTSSTVASPVAMRPA
jgi:hypothetical protein